MLRLKLALIALVVVHFVVVFVNVTAFFVLPFTTLILSRAGVEIPFWFSIFLIMPIESIILFLSFSRTPCPLTLLENFLRKKLGMKEIGGFIGHYLIKQRWRKKGLHAESVCVRANP